MHHHGSSCLNGPVTLDRPWWVRPARKPRPRVRTKDTDIRSNLVASVRREIAAGTYDTPERWDAALDRLARKLQIP